MNQRKILICYDGSADSQAAIAHAGQLLPGSEAIVLVIWETIEETLMRSGSLGMGGYIGDYGDGDRALELAARRTADEGAQRATAAGLLSEPLIAGRRNDIADVILTAAGDIGADMIVVGSRGRSGVKSILLGSVSQAVLRHASQPVLVVPSPVVAAHRAMLAAEHARLTAGVA